MHTLASHLTAVSDLAARFAAPFGAERLAAAAGAWHDLGKVSPAFQAYLRDCEQHPSGHARGPDHKGAGAIHAAHQGAEPLSLIIQGHHGGLADLVSSRAWLKERLQDGELTRLLEALPGGIAKLCDRAPGPTPNLEPLDAEMFLRLLFSCLVDADGLDTEAHFNPGISSARRAHRASIAEVDTTLRAHVEQVRVKVPATAVNGVRATIYERAMAASTEAPGLFRLAVPTGGGKTLTGLSFAAAHAARHGLRQIVVAVPFTSITEQTAEVYRSVLGAANVIEHHSAVDPRARADSPPLARLWTRLAADNWDAPVVVTTTVRLFESLLSNRVSDTRRLHRLVRSVIIIDEAQALPTQILEPAIHVLQQLVCNYGSTVVLSTATQPTSDRPTLDWLATAREVVADPAPFFAALRRVDWQVADRWDAKQVGGEITARPQVLCILNTRREALAVLEHSPADALHLSTLLCGAHRRTVLAEVRARLVAGSDCRLVSTQVVEAGVDLDFPVVLRALAPLDSIIQAAGRCNREGRMARGHVVVFQGGQHPPGPYRLGTDVTRSLLTPDRRDLDDPELVGEYFRALYRNVNLDIHQVQLHRRQLAYEEVARRFRMIDDEGTAVVVPYGEGESLAREAAVEGHPGRARAIWSQLQPYTVNLRRRELRRALREGWVQDLGQILLWAAPYDELTGVGRCLMEEVDAESTA